MVQPSLIILSALPTVMLDLRQYDRIDPVRRLRHPKAGMMTVATIGAFGGPLYHHNRMRDWRVSWGMVCLSAASFAGAYHLLRRVPRRGAG